MRIIGAEVYDPRTSSFALYNTATMPKEQLGPVELHIMTDEEVMENDDPRYNGPFRLINCGPFFAAEQRIGDQEGQVDWRDATPPAIGKMNTKGIIIGQIMPVKVSWTSGDREEMPLVMTINRVRRILRKFKLPWSVLVDEHAANQGRIQWRLERTDPVCYGSHCFSVEQHPRTKPDGSIGACTGCPECNDRHFQSRPIQALGIADFANNFEKIVKGCEGEPVKTIIWKQAHIPLCANHLARYEKGRLGKRLQAAN